MVALNAKILVYAQNALMENISMSKIPVMTAYLIVLSVETLTNVIIVDRNSD